MIQLITLRKFHITFAVSEIQLHIELWCSIRITVTFDDDDHKIPLFYTPFICKLPLLARESIRRVHLSSNDWRSHVANDDNARWQYR